MKKLIQTRLHNPPKQNGNCYPTVIACFLDCDSPEDVFQVQEHYTGDLNDISWFFKLSDWLMDRGWQIEYFDGHVFDNSFYFVTGESQRGTSHICIYQNGELWHDPHPDQTGLVDEKYFERIVKF